MDKMFIRASAPSLALLFFTSCNSSPSGTAGEDQADAIEEHAEMMREAAKETVTMESPVDMSKPEEDAVGSAVGEAVKNPDRGH